MQCLLKSSFCFQFPENSNGASSKAVSETEAKPESPKFDLETSSFPPLPGCMVRINVFSNPNFYHYLSYIIIKLLIKLVVIFLCVLELKIASVVDNVFYFQEPDSIEIDPYINNSSRLSDIVKGTVKPTTRDTKTQTESATKDSSTITVKEAGPSDGAFSPPVSPDL